MMDLDPRTVRENTEKYFAEFAKLRPPAPVKNFTGCYVQEDAPSGRDHYAESLERKSRIPTQPSGGGALTGDHYYRVRVEAPVAPDLGAYVAECADIIEALGMTFNEGECFKALWRLAAARQGKAKGTSAQYDADKVAHYGARVAAHSPKL